MMLVDLSLLSLKLAVYKIKPEALSIQISRAVKDCRVPIKLSHLFELGNMTKYPAVKMGKTRVHTESNLDKVKIIYRR